MYTYTLILNLYEFIDKIPEKLQGEKRAKMSKNRSKCVSFFVDGISETLRYGPLGKSGEKFSAVCATGRQSIERYFYVIFDIQVRIPCISIFTHII